MIDPRKGFISILHNSWLNSVFDKGEKILLLVFELSLLSHFISRSKLLSSLCVPFSSVSLSSNSFPNSIIFSFKISISYVWRRNKKVLFVLIFSRKNKFRINLNDRHLKLKEWFISKLNLMAFTLLVLRKSKGFSDNRQRSPSQKWQSHCDVTESSAALCKWQWHDFVRCSISRSRRVRRPFLNLVLLILRNYQSQVFLRFAFLFLSSIFKEFVH